ncbi:MAG: hypothetical protein JXL20_03475 [Deltaproteobacteria bacterium]|nr:hypothetical protein [Deltaproteobacteria bacterium]
MNGDKAKDTQKSKKKPSSHVLRDRIGGAPKAIQELSREHAKIKKQIRNALMERSRIVPELFESTQIPIETLFWHLMSLKKYGEVIEGEDRDGYVEYALKPKEEKPS